MKDKVYYYAASVYGYSSGSCVDFIVRAENAKKAVDIVYNQICYECPPQEQKAHGYEPMYKKDITVRRIDKLYYDKNGLTEPYIL